MARMAGHGVALDAGDLHQTANGVTGQAQVMLHGHFCGVFHLIQVQAVQLRQSRRRHGAGGADLCLAAAFGAGDRGVPLGKRADDAGGGQAPADFLVGEVPCVLDVFEGLRGNYAAGAAGGGQ